MTEKAWRIACDRALLYVRGYPLGCLEGLELVVEVLRQTRALAAQEQGINPAAETLRLLRERLERNADPRPKVPGPFPLKRGSMVPGGMDSLLWHLPPARFFRNKKGPV